MTRRSFQLLAGAALAAEKQIKVALLTQADGPHLSAYIPSLLAPPEIASVAVAGLPDPKGLGPKLGGVYKDAAELFRKEKPARAQMERAQLGRAGPG